MIERKNLQVKKYSLVILESSDKIVANVLTDGRAATVSMDSL
jgi:hypothetical protein